MKQIFTFNQLLEQFQKQYGLDHDIVFYEIVFYLSKNVKSKEDLITKRNDSIDFKYKKYLKLLNQYFKKQKPLAHIVGSTNFCGLNFKIDKKVLAPRDVTQEMVDDFILSHKDDSEHTVIDLCCGSGVIGISIKKYLKQFNVICIDKYWKPIINTIENGNKHLAALTVDKKDAIKYLNSFNNVDIIISNPPYVNLHNFHNKKMFKYECKKALIAKDNGLYFYSKFFEYLTNHPFNEAWFEYGYDQRDDLRKLLSQYPNLKYDMALNKQYIVIKPKKD